MSDENERIRFLHRRLSAVLPKQKFVPKTLSSYEQSLGLFFAYLTTEHGVERLREVRTGHIRQYIAYVQERGKYTVVNRDASMQINHPEDRTDYKK
ncbi:site-specific integrase [Tumebacillus amylolyticus]|uniref:site-specific integrase n=1 Tax=Tumebacillus amylolyticus TaxID=2801339 RepID=UPI001F1ACC69|nr:site-specific integrase [Tumebacillus amylolyticus]